MDQIEATFHEGFKGNQPYSQVDIDPTQVDFPALEGSMVLDVLVAKLSENVGEERAMNGTITTIDIHPVKDGSMMALRRYKLSAAPPF